MTRSSSGTEPSGSRRRARVPALLFGPLFLLLTACGLPLQETIGSIFDKPVSVAAAPLPLKTLADEPKPYRWPEFIATDGRVVRTMWVPAGTCSLLDTSLKGIAEWEAVERTLSGKVVITDPNDTPDHKGWAKHAGLESIILRGPREKIDACSDLIQHVLSSIPNVLVEARVVEVLESDEFALGFDFFLLDGGAHTFDPAMPFAPLSPSKTIFDRGTLGSGIPPLPGIVRTGFLPNLLLELGVIKGDIQIDLIVSALAQVTKIDVVNAPNVTVRSGHVATISAGSQVPYFTVQVSGSNQVVSTQFKKVAVNLHVMPTVTGQNTLKMVVHLDVENVTGVATVESGGASTTNPIISSRKVLTVMDVQDGATVVLGGLIQTTELSVRERVPVLGDIPLVGELFSNRHTKESRSNLLFFLRPRILNPDGGRDSAVILPPQPGEKIAPSSPDIITPPDPDKKKGQKKDEAGKKPGK